MKRLILVFAALLIVTATTVPSFADGNPMPHGSVCRTCGILPTIK